MAFAKKPPMKGGKGGKDKDDGKKAPPWAKKPVKKK